jgi:hypothetical protein
MLAAETQFGLCRRAVDLMPSPPKPRIHANLDQRDDGESP